MVNINNSYIDKYKLTSIEMTSVHTQKKHAPDLFVSIYEFTLYKVHYKQQQQQYIILINE